MNNTPLPSGEHDCLMTEVQIRSPTTSSSSTKHKHPTNWLKAHLCQNKFTFGLCLSLLLSIAIVICLLFLYILHTRIRKERKKIIYIYILYLYNYSDFKENYVLHLNAFH